MPVYKYKTIVSPTTGLFKDKGSKFLAFAYPAETEDEIKSYLLQLRKEYYDARHHCYAWMLGADKKLFRANDDGEPNHSAGDPILGQIKSFDLTNVLVVVVRYFGGTKLGVSGLINAYKASTGDALSKAQIIEKDVLMHAHITYNYELTPEVMRLVKDFDLHITDQSFLDNCTMDVQLRLEHEDLFNEKVKLLQALGNKLEVTFT